MTVTKIVTSTVPDETVLHYFQTPAAAPVYNAIIQVTRLYKNNIISYEKYKDSTKIITKTKYNSREISDEFDKMIYDQFPNYKAERDAYHAAVGIVWTVTYE